MRGKTVIASTLGVDSAEMEDYRYKSTRTRQPIYSIGKYYFAVGNTKPKDDVG